VLEFLKAKFALHFDKLLLAVLFVATIWIAVHLMHKSDAGGDDATFITWAQTQAAMILGALLGLIKGDSKSSDSVTSTTTTQVKETKD